MCARLKRRRKIIVVHKLMIFEKENEEREVKNKKGKNSLSYTWLLEMVSPLKVKLHEPIAPRRGLTQRATTSTIVRSLIHLEQLLLQTKSSTSSLAPPGHLLKLNHTNPLPRAHGIKITIIRPRAASASRLFPLEICSTVSSNSSTRTTSLRFCALVSRHI